MPHARAVARRLELEVPPLGDAEFRLFRALLRDHCGLHFEDDARYLLESRLAARLRALDLGSYAAYHWLLRADSDGAEELATLIDDLMVNESWFLRERATLRALIGEIVPVLREREGDGGPVRIWSAGCAGGEEPYSIAMLALEAGLVPGRDLELHASDISRRALARADRGLYRAAALRECEPALRQRFFLPYEGGFRIVDDVKRAVSFSRVNLLDRGRAALLPRMDVVLCRNVLIYFDADSRARVAERFVEKLRPKGWLLLGHADATRHVSQSFELVHLEGVLAHRRPSGGGARPPLGIRLEPSAQEPT